MSDMAGKLDELSIAEDGSVTLTVKDSKGRAEVTIPAEKAADSLMALLQGIARAAQRPGPAYEMALKPLGVGSDIQERAGSDPTPVLLLKLEYSTFLRVVLDPKDLRPLAQQLLQRADALDQRQSPSKLN